MKSKGEANLSLGTLNFEFFFLFIFFLGNYVIKVRGFNLSYFVYLLNTRSGNHGNQVFFKELF
jgi:hypothetical protein